MTKEKRLKCQLCPFTTNSDQMFSRHCNQHPELKRSTGRPRKADKKSRKDINRDYYSKKRSSSVTTATTATPPPKPKPKPKKRPIGFTKAEPSTTIGAFSWLPTLSATEALEFMAQDSFWYDCIEHNLDPLWAYRYLCWRLGHPSQADWRLFNALPGAQQPTRVVIEYL